MLGNEYMEKSTSELNTCRQSMKQYKLANSETPN